MALVGMFAWMSWNSYWIVLNDTDDLSSNLALSVEQFVARTIETVDLSLQAVADEVEAARPRARPDIEALLDERLRRTPQLTGLAAYGGDGRLRAGIGPFFATGSTSGDAATLRAADDGDGLRILLTEHKQIVLSRRFKRGDGSARSRRDAQRRLPAAILLPPSHRRGRRHRPRRRGWHPSCAQALCRSPRWREFRREPIVQAMAADRLGGCIPDARTRPTAVGASSAYQSVEKLPLVVEVALSRDEALAHWRSRALLQGGVAAVLLLILGIGAMMLHRELGARLLAHAQLRDTVTELERARRVAEEASRVKSEFMAHMSHELRTPLNAIIGFSEAIRDAVMGPVSARYRDYARDIHSSGSHLLRLIKDILDLSKVEAGRARAQGGDRRPGDARRGLPPVLRRARGGRRA